LIHEVGGGVTVDQTCFCSCPQHRQSGGNEGVRRNQDLVTAPNSCCPQSQFDGVRAIGHPNAELSFAEASERRLELSNLASEDERRSLEHPAPARLDVGAYILCLPVEVDQRNLNIR